MRITSSSVRQNILERNSFKLHMINIFHDFSHKVQDATRGVLAIYIFRFIFSHSNARRDSSFLQPLTTMTKAVHYDFK